MQAEDALERRIVTVLFADLVGFTTLSEQFDPEDVAAIQDRYFAIVRETIGRYGGRLEKFIGDAAMAVFGVPRSRDDDAERAVRAGLALTHAVQQLGVGMGLDEDVLQLRVGINSGEAVVAAAGADEGRVTGDTVNTAARFQTAAPPGGVLIGESTALAVADVAELGEQLHLELKGKAEPAAARVVTGFRSEPSRERAMGDLRAPTVGRGAELEELEAAVARTSDGTVERWLVVAPPGVGKSRLLHEVEQRAGRRAGAVVWRSRARAGSVAPFDPIAGLFGAALGEVASRPELEARVVARLTAAGIQAARAAVVADACASLLWPRDANDDAPQRPSEERDALFAAWLDGLDALAGETPQIWLVEDIHWAGGDVLAFLDLASERVARAGRLVVATARPSLLDEHAAWANVDDQAGRRILRLGTLEATDAGDLIRALVGDALPSQLVARIVERSDGNCLFIEELLRTWVSVGTLVHDANTDTWQLAVPADDIPLPHSVQSIYAAQLDDLPPDARRLARRASVAGRRFPVRALKPLDASDAGLEPLRRRELMTGPVDEPLFGDAFSYRHALLRDAGYASLARAERARLHVRLAAWLEQAAGDHASEVAEQIAGHYAAAAESAPALTREIDTGIDRDTARRLAAEWYERAGQGTLSLSAHDAARELFRRSIDLTANDLELDQARRWERLGDATAFAADMDAGAAAYERSIELYRTSIEKMKAGFEKGARGLEKAAEWMGPGSKLHQQMSGLRGLMGAQGWDELTKGLAQGADEIRQGGEEIRAAGDNLAAELAAAQAGLARAGTSLSNVEHEQLRFAESRELAAELLGELADADDASRARLLLARSMAALGASGSSPEIEADVDRAYELAASTANEEVKLRAAFARASIRAEAGHGTADDWRGLFERAVAAGEWRMAISAATNSALFAIDDAPRDVAEDLQRARDIAVAHGLTEDAGWVSYQETEEAFASGDWSRALEVGRSAIELGMANHYLRMAVRTVHVVVPIAAVRGETEVLALCQSFYDSLEGSFDFPDSPYARIVRPAQDLELGAAGLRAAYVPDAETRIASFDTEATGPSLVAALDRVLRSWVEVGELDGAARALDTMAGALDRASMKTHLAVGTYHLMRGRLALARGDSAAATTHGREALAQFRTSDAPWWIAKVIRLLERAGDADYQLVAEAFDIERRLGAIAPTA